MASQGKAKHREIYEHVHRRILKGEYGVGQRIPTESELARHFDTSRVTVARALRDLEHQGLLLRRRGAGSFVQHRQTPAGNLFGTITCDTPGIFATITNEMSRVAHTNGFGLLLDKCAEGDIDNIVRFTEELCEQYLARKVTGVFFTPMQVPAAQVEVNVRITEAFDRANIPLILLDRDIYDYPRRSKYDLVGIDNFHAGYVLATHLLDLGYRKIGFFSHRLSVSTGTARMAGYRYALTKHGIAPQDEWIFRGDGADLNFIRDALDRSRMEAFVCINDHEAAKLMRSLSALHVRVPGDIAVVGIDDDQWATFLSVSLTTLRQPCAALGAAAIRMMIERLSEPRMPARETCFACSLIVRQSCGAELRGAQTQQTINASETITVPPD